MRYLLDTNIVSAVIRDPQGRVTERIREVGEANVATSIIVAAELRYGAAKKRSARLTAQIEAVLGALEVLPFEDPADRVYGVLRAGLEQKGQPIGGNDLLIAAQALSHLDSRWSPPTNGSFPRSRTFHARTGSVKPAAAVRTSTSAVAVWAGAPVWRF